MERRNSSKLVKKGGKADPVNYGGITLLSTVGKTFNNIFNDVIEWERWWNRKKK